MDTAPTNPSPAGPVTAVIVVAAGSGQRLGYGMPKAKVPLGGDTILTHALRGVGAAGIAQQICVAIPPGDSELQALCEAFTQEIAALHRRTAASGRGVPVPLVTVVDGGASRAESVRAAMAALLPAVDSVLVHDAARALAPESVFHRVVAALGAGAAAVIPVIPVVDTVKTVEATTGDGVALAPEVVTGTAAREFLRAVQTPQGFARDILQRAHEAAAGFDADRAALVTDDAMLVELLGVPVHAVRGASQSLKITTPLDLILAEGLLEGPLGARWVEG